MNDTVNDSEVRVWNLFHFLIYFVSEETGQNKKIQLNLSTYQQLSRGLLSAGECRRCLG